MQTISASGNSCLTSSSKASTSPCCLLPVNSICRRQRGMTSLSLRQAPFASRILCCSKSTKSSSTCTSRRERRERHHHSLRRGSKRHSLSISRNHRCLVATQQSSTKTLCLQQRFRRRSRTGNAHWINLISQSRPKSKPSLASVKANAL